MNNRDTKFISGGYPVTVAVPNVNVPPKLTSDTPQERTTCCYKLKYNTNTTYLLTLWCRVLLEKLTGLQLVKKFPAFHGT